MNKKYMLLAIALLLIVVGVFAIKHFELKKYVTYELLINQQVRANKDFRSVKDIKCTPDSNYVAKCQIKDLELNSFNEKSNADQIIKLSEILIFNPEGLGEQISLSSTGFVPVSNSKVKIEINNILINDKSLGEQLSNALKGSSDSEELKAYLEKEFIGTTNLLFISDMKKEKDKLNFLSGIAIVVGNSSINLNSKYIVNNKLVELMKDLDKKSVEDQKEINKKQLSEVTINELEFSFLNKNKSMIKDIVALQIKSNDASKQDLEAVESILQQNKEELIEDIKVSIKDPKLSEAIQLKINDIYAGNTSSITVTLSNELKLNVAQQIEKIFPFFLTKNFDNINQNLKITIK